MTQKLDNTPAEAEAAPNVAAEKPMMPRAKSSFGSPGSRAGFPTRSVRPAAGGQPMRTDAAKGLAKAGGPRQGFKAGEFIVYPAHGVGEIVAIEEEEVAGFKLELFVISFAKDKMKLKVPLPKVTAVGMRKLSEPEVVQRGLDTLAGRARVKRTMWSRRAQEYEAKINSGDLIAVAEVVRDLYRSDAQPEQSYSERQLYEAALDRLAREIAAVQKLTDSEVGQGDRSAIAEEPTEKQSRSRGGSGGRCGGGRRRRGCLSRYPPHPKSPGSSRAFSCRRYGMRSRGTTPTPDRDVMPIR